MSNPWRNTVEDVALRPLIKFLDNDQKITSVAVAEERLANDPSDLITKLRIADALTKATHEQEDENQFASLKPETIIVNNLAKELSEHLSALDNSLGELYDGDRLKLSMLRSVKLFGMVQSDLSNVNKAKLIECIKNLVDFLPRLFKSDNNFNAADLLVLTQAVERLSDDNEYIPPEFLFDTIKECYYFLLQHIIAHNDATAVPF